MDADERRIEERYPLGDDRPIPTRPTLPPDPLLEAYGDCDICGRRINVEAIGRRCARCRIAHGQPPAAPNPYLVRVEAPTGIERAADAAYGWESEAIV
jgi:hypothetical protein